MALVVAMAPIELQAACSSDASEPDDGCYVSTVVLHGSQIATHNFCDDAADWMRFNACSGRAYTIQTTNLGSSADTVLELYGPDCTSLLASDDNGGGGNASLLMWTAPDDGTYHLKIRQASGSAGENRGYNIHLAGDTSACATWANEYQNPVETSLGSLSQTADGGFFATGTRVGLPNWAAWAGRLDRAGRIMWQRYIVGTDATYTGGPGVQTSDGGFLFAGSRDQQDGTGSDAWLVRFDPAGNILWQRTYGGSSGDILTDLQLTSDGGFILAGSTFSFGNESDQDAWVLRLDSAGNVVWSKRCGDDGSDEARAVRRTSDGGFLFVGAKENSGSMDAWVVRLNASGGIVWQRTVGESGFDTFISVAVTSEDVAFLTGQSETLDPGALWVIKMDPSGAIMWQNAYSGPQNGGAPLHVTSDGGLAVASALFEGQNMFEGWLLKLNASGTILTQKRVPMAKGLAAIAETSDGGLVISGYEYDGASIVLRTGADGSSAGCPLLMNKTGTSSVTTATAVSSGAAGHNLSVTRADTNAPISASGFVVSSACPCAPSIYGGSLSVDKNSLPSGASARLTWTAAGSPLSFDVAQGDLATLHSTLGDFTAALNAAAPAAACMCDDTTALSTNDMTSAPSAGNGAFYVLRPQSTSCLGSYDSGSSRQMGSRDREIAIASSACP